MSSARRRGFNAERELARILWNKGFAVVRAPASGAKARRLIYPDIVALYRGKIYVIEVKYRNSAQMYITAKQVQKLEEFAQRAGGVPLIAVKIPRKGWYIVDPKIAKRTASGVRIDEDIIAKADTLEEFVNKVVNKGLDLFRGKDEGSDG